MPPDEEFVFSRKKNKDQEKKSLSATPPSRKIPRDHGQTLAKEDNAEEEEEANYDDTDKESVEELEEVKPGKKWKREVFSSERISN